MSYIVSGIPTLFLAYNNFEPSYPEAVFGIFDTFEEADKAFCDIVNEIFAENLKYYQFYELSNYDEAISKKDNLFFNYCGNGARDEDDPQICWEYIEYGSNKNASPCEDYNGERLEKHWRLFFSPWFNDDVRRFPFVYIRKIKD